MKICFNIILTSTTTCSKASVFLKFPQQNPLWTSALHLKGHTSHAHHSSVFDQPNKIWCKMQKMKVLIMQWSVAYSSARRLIQCRTSQWRNCLVWQLKFTVAWTILMNCLLTLLLPCQHGEVASVHMFSPVSAGRSYWNGPHARPKTNAVLLQCFYR